MGLESLKICMQHCLLDARTASRASAAAAPPLTSNARTPPPEPSKKAFARAWSGELGSPG